MSEKGMEIIHSKNAFLGLKDVNLDFYEHCLCLWKIEKIQIVESWRSKKRRMSQCIYMCGDILRYHLLIAPIIILHLLMIQPRKLGFIIYVKIMMFVTLLRSGNLLQRMKHVKGQSVTNKIMEVNIVAKSLKTIAHTMAFVGRRLFHQEHLNKMVFERG